ncbi:MAG: TIGR03089 family protein, partial [Frankiaceae bacterium]
MVRPPGVGPLPAAPRAEGVAAALAARLAADGAQPFVTYYSDTAGERTELSVATLNNWVAKTANLLVDGLSLQPGDTVRLAVPLHWQEVAIRFAALSAGAEIVSHGPSAVLFWAE